MNATHLSRSFNSHENVYVKLGEVRVYSRAKLWRVWDNGTGAPGAVEKEEVAANGSRRRTLERRRKRRWGCGARCNRKRNPSAAVIRTGSSRHDDVAANSGPNTPETSRLPEVAEEMKRRASPLAAPDYLFFIFAHFFRTHENSSLAINLCKFSNSLLHFQRLSKKITKISPISNSTFFYSKWF